MEKRIRTVTVHTRRTFAIARSAAGAFERVILELEEDDAVGRGEAAPTRYYGQDAASVAEALQNLEIRKRNMLSDDDLRAIQAPALVLWTTKDPSGPVDEARRIASLIPGAQLAVMDNCGHWPQYEDTETFNEIHLDFLLGS